MSNGSTNGCHQSQPVIQDVPMDFHASQQPNIHPGCISSTGRNGRSTTVSPPDQQMFQMWANSMPPANGAHSTGGGVTNSISGGLSSVSLGGNLMAAATSQQNVGGHHLIGIPPHAIDAVVNSSNLSQVGGLHFFLNIIL